MNRRDFIKSTVGLLGLIGVTQLPKVPEKPTKPAPPQPPVFDTNTTGYAGRTFFDYMEPNNFADVSTAIDPSLLYARHKYEKTVSWVDGVKYIHYKRLD